MTRLDAVLWDMDGTLLDSEKLWDLAVRELAAELGGEMTDEIRHALIGASGPNAMRILFNGLHLDPTPEALGQAAHFIEHRITDLFTNGTIPWRPGAQDALTMLLEADIPMALVTNTKRSLTEFGLDTLGRHHFQTSVCADEVPQGKPAPDLYLRAAELLGVAPNRCVVIEDSHTGAQGAEAAGCALLVIPCEIPVPDAPGRTFRDSLIGLTTAELGDISTAHRSR